MLLSLIAGVATAAGTCVVLDGPVVLPRRDCASVSAAERAASGAWSPADDAALAQLRAETDAIRPLFDAFDGELDVMRRLDAALASVRVVRPETAEVVWRARVLLGYAVHRYFQKDLSTDPAAARYRVEVEGEVRNAYWVDAIGADPERAPDAALLSDDRARLAYQELRARILLVAPGTVRVAAMPGGDSLIVDGRERVAGLAQVGPGLHDLAVVGPDGVRSWERVAVGSGQVVTIVVPPSSRQRVDLADALRRRDPTPIVPDTLRVLFDGLEAPVVVTSADEVSAAVYNWEGGVLRPQRAGRARSVTSRSASEGMSIDGAFGAGWRYDGDYLLLNYVDGAPSELGTVNAVAPRGQLAVRYRRGLAQVGVAATVEVPIGAWHTLPTGEQPALRPRGGARIELGTPWLAVTGGFLAPWHATLGGRASMPLGGEWWLDVDYEEGLGITRPRAGAPDFQPAATRGVGLSFRGAFDLPG